jgi:tubby and related proteins
MFSLLMGHFYFSVALADDGKFLLAARKRRRPACSEFLISLDKCDVSKGNGTYIGKLR